MSSNDWGYLWLLKQGGVSGSLLLASSSLYQLEITELPNILQCTEQPLLQRTILPPVLLMLLLRNLALGKSTISICFSFCTLDLVEKSLG